MRKTSILSLLIFVTTICTLFISCSGNELSLSSEAEILSFEIKGAQNGSSILSNEEKTINLNVTYNADLENLIADFTISEGASAYVGELVQEPGTTSNDFTTPIIYRIESEDGQIVTNWTITVLKNEPPEFIVSTLVENFPGNDGISVDIEGNIYVNSNGLLNQWNGQTIHKVTPNGSVSLFAENLPQWPVGSIFDGDGNLYVTGWRQPGIITKIAPDGIKEQFASGIAEPSGLEIDTDGSLYVMEPPTKRMLRIKPNGDIENFATSSSFNTASGVTYDKTTNTFYVSNWADGVISKVSSTGNVSTFLTLPVNNLGPILLVDEFIYVTNPNGNRIYRIDKSTKEYKLLAGTGLKGNKDGAAEFATFNYPLGVGVSNDHKLIYISEVSPNGSGRLRVIQGYEE